VTAAFIEIREASHGDHICVCGTSIGRGDQYKREALPPWSFRYYNNEGDLIDTGDGLWIVIKRCYNCMGNQGGADGLQSTHSSGW
jgi:hypothetical protein